MDMLATLPLKTILPGGMTRLPDDFIPLLLAAAAAFGAILGSFANAAAYRLPRGISLVTRKRSFCPKCQHDLAWYDNVPILSYLLLLGRCRHCKARIPIRYLLVELACAGLVTLAVHVTLVLNQGPFTMAAGSGWQLDRPGPFYGLGETMIFAAVVLGLVIAAVSDLETGYVPDAATVPLIVIGILASPFMPDLHFARMDVTGLPWLDSLVDAVLGAMAGGGVVWFAGAAAELILKRPAMGGGDVKLLAAVGAVLGWKAAYLVFFLSPFAALVVALPMRLVKSPVMVYDLPDESETVSDRDRFDNCRLSVAGLLVFAVHAALAAVVYVRFRLGAVPMYSPLFFGMSYALMMVLMDSVRRRTVRQTGHWLNVQVETDAAGNRQEKIRGGIPFGPFLAAAALVVLFYQPAMLNLIYRYMMIDPLERFPHQAPFM
jgi:leader peptidase (prepilin peptidase) / N-methyltransferase